MKERQQIKTMKKFCPVNHTQKSKQNKTLEQLLKHKKKNRRKDKQKYNLTFTKGRYKIGRSNKINRDGINKPKVTFDNVKKTMKSQNHKRII